MNDFELVPLASYNIPKYPTYEDAKLEPKLLKKIPSRWKKNLAALACIGLLSVGTTTALSGCFILNRCLNSCLGSCTIHMGGSGMPIYVVYLTEQEALDVMRNKAEYMGLELNDTPPNISVTASWDNRQVNLKLFNEDKNIAFSHVGANNFWDWEINKEHIANEAQEAFDEKDSDLIVKVFHSNAISSSRNTRDEDHEYLKQHLTAQVREFIEWLQAEGIIQ
ncbi:MAG: hypothetical protein FWE03_01940 [Firmicutes bacterium]|nr:hypothetical protein [Bacillota bacterium]